jgi:hypothetical protein
VVSPSKKTVDTKKIAIATKVNKKPKVDNDALLKRIIKVEEVLKKISGQLNTIIKTAMNYVSDKKIEEQGKLARTSEKKAPVKEKALGAGVDVTVMKKIDKNQQKTSSQIEPTAIPLPSVRQETVNKTEKQTRETIEDKHIAGNTLYEKIKPQIIKEPNNSFKEVEAKKDIPPKTVKRKSISPIKEDTQLSFRFKVFFKRTDDEKSMIQKSDKISAYINTYLGSQGFLKKHDLLKKTGTTSEVGIENVLPVIMETVPRAEYKECISYVSERD